MNNDRELSAGVLPSAAFTPSGRSEPLAARAPALLAFWMLTVQMLLAPCQAATVRWTGGRGDWGASANWTGGALPGPNNDAVIDASNGAITVTISKAV